MANMCRHFLTVSGPEDKVKQVYDLFKKMEEATKKASHGQLPPFYEGDDSGHMFDIEVGQQNESINYSTKWSPNSEVLVQIAKKYGVQFSCEYEELGCLMYGEYKMEDDGELMHRRLEDSDFKLYEEDEETCTYIYKGDEFDSEWEILELLLEGKEFERVI